MSRSGDTTDGTCGTPLEEPTRFPLFRIASLADAEDRTITGFLLRHHLENLREIPEAAISRN